MNAKSIYKTLSHYNKCLYASKEKQLPYEETHFKALITGYLISLRDQENIDETEYHRLIDLFINHLYEEKNEVIKN